MFDFSNFSHTKHTMKYHDIFKDIHHGKCTVVSHVTMVQHDVITLLISAFRFFHCNNVVNVKPPWYFTVWLSSCHDVITSLSPCHDVITSVSYCHDVITSLHCHAGAVCTLLQFPQPRTSCLDDRAICYHKVDVIC